LRAQGIPARYVFGIIADPESPTPEESSAGHAWIQVWYPKVGWVNYDPTSAMIHLPNHIEFTANTDQTSGPGLCSADHFAEQWYSVGLGNTKK
jgi:transglutaminase-like putative cysteine protease